MASLLALGSISPGQGIKPAKVVPTWKSIHHYATHWDVRFVYPHFNPSSEIMRTANEGIEEYARKETDSFLTSAKEDWKAANTGVTRPYAYDAKTLLSVASPTLISLYFDIYTDQSGAHPNRALVAMSFGEVGGRNKRLTLQDLFVNGVDAKEVVSRLVLPKLRAKEASAVPDKSLTDSEAENFVVTPHGLTFLFSPYEVASYAEGSFSVDIVWSELSGINQDGPLKNLLRR